MIWQPPLQGCWITMFMQMVHGYLLHTIRSVAANSMNQQFCKIAAESPSKFNERNDFAKSLFILHFAFSLP
jgi:hypothetical protein